MLKLNFWQAYFLYDSSATYGGNAAERYTKLVQGTHSVCTTDLRVCTHIFVLQMLKDSSMITLQWPCTLLQGCSKNAAKCMATAAICTIAALRVLYKVIQASLFCLAMPANSLDLHG